jgi:integrin alpha FG-GAP repeat containing protein 1
VKQAEFFLIVASFFMRRGGKVFLLVLICFTAAQAVVASLLGPSGARGAPSFSGNSAFSNASTYVQLASSNNLRPVKLADLNSDEYIDVLALDNSTNKLYVSFWNHNAYQFGSPLLLLDEAVSHAITADFNGDGISDVMAFLKSGVATVLLGSHSGNFSTGSSISLNQNVTSGLVFSRYGDLVPDVFIPEPNGSFLVLTNNRGTKGTFQKSQWTPAGCQPRGNLSAFLDMNGDCLPDLVLVCDPASSTGPPRAAPGPRGPPPAAASGTQVAVWFNRGKDDILASATPSQVWAPFGGIFQIEQVLYGDFTGKGTNSLLALTNAGKLLYVANSHGNGGYGQRCNFHGSMNLLQALPVSISSSNGQTNLTLSSGARLSLIDFNYDVYPDLYVVNGSNGTLLKNTAQKGMLSFQGQQTSSFDALYTISNPVVASAYDTDQDGRQDLLVGTDQGIQLWFNTISQPRSFLETAVLTAVSAYASPRLFSESVGSTSIVAFQATNGLQLYACSQCPNSGVGGFISPCQCFTGLDSMLNYVQELAVGAGSTQRSWTNLLPNSFAVIYPQDPANANSWRLEFYTQRNIRSIVGVIIVLTSAMIALGGAIIFLLWREHRQDKQARLARETYQSFVAYS